MPAICYFSLSSSNESDSALRKDCWDVYESAESVKRALREIRCLPVR